MFTTCPAPARPRQRSSRDNAGAIDLLNAYGARLEYLSGFLGLAEEEHWRRTLERSIEFDSPEASRVFVHGKWRAIPRRQCAHGDDDCPGYRFSRTVVEPRPWTGPLQELRDQIARRTGFRANFVLVNHYAHAGEYISWHADDERDLDPAAPIASLSLGSAREFQFRPRTPGEEPGTVTMMLEAGSLLTMHAPTNSRFQHCLPWRTGRAAGNIGPRWNPTFRRMIGGN